ncbi:MAG TPA: cupin domain-containing protein [Stellaceae bacterium]|nr:cupin domain-containing protein [Stellaceae bacterium]
MTTPTPEALARAGTLDELYPQLSGIGLGAGWNKPTPSLWAAPHQTFPPYQWRYAQAKGALDAAGRLINTELAERRNLILVNPLEGNGYGTSRTLVAAYQMIMPGEKARSHRHTPNALRLVLDASAGAYTTVNGKRLPMAPNDVVLTPNWCWHGHGNDGKGRAYWLDFLDVPLVHLLDPMFFEPHPADFEDDAPEAPNSPLLFPWRDTERRLAAASPDPTGRHGVAIEFGHPALDTMALAMMRLPPDQETQPYRTTANTLYAAVEGEGSTMVEGKRFDWARGDVVVVPSWHTHCHRASGGAVLFRVTDEPLMDKLGFLRSEAAPLAAH